MSEGPSDFGASAAGDLVLVSAVAALGDASFGEDGFLDGSLFTGDNGDLGESVLGDLGESVLNGDFTESPLRGDDGDLVELLFIGDVGFALSPFPECDFTVSVLTLDDFPESVFEEAVVFLLSALDSAGEGDFS